MTEEEIYDRLDRHALVELQTVQGDHYAVGRIVAYHPGPSVIVDIDVETQTSSRVAWKSGLVYDVDPTTLRPDRRPT